MKSKAAGCGSISTVISSIALLCVSSIIIIIIIIIIIMRKLHVMNKHEFHYYYCKVFFKISVLKRLGKALQNSFIF